IPPAYTDEQVRDVVAATLVAGANVTITPDDGADTITISASGSGGGGGAVDSVNGQTGVVELDYEDVGAAPEEHTHAAGDITSGTLAIARIPTGTSSSTVAVGNHSHDPMSLVGTDAAYARYHTTADQTVATADLTEAWFGTAAVSHSWVTRATFGDGHYFTFEQGGIWAISANI